jgi:DNA-binding transcriptional ArsR family regulator
MLNGIKMTPPPPCEPEASQTIRLEDLKLLSDPLRAHLVEALIGQALTVKELAARFGLPPTRLYYHVNLLEKHGFIQVADTRWVSGILEKHYRATARQYRVDRSPFADPAGDVLDDTKADIRHSVRAGRIDLAQTAPHLQTLLLKRGFGRLTPARARHFYKQLAALIEAFTEAPAGDGEDLYALAVAFYPTLYPPEAPHA